MSRRESAAASDRSVLTLTLEPGYGGYFGGFPYGNAKTREWSERFAGLLDGAICPDCAEPVEDCQAKANAKGSCWRWNEEYKPPSLDCCDSAIATGGAHHSPDCPDAQ